MLTRMNQELVKTIKLCVAIPTKLIEGCLLAERAMNLTSIFVDNSLKIRRTYNRLSTKPTRVVLLGKNTHGSCSSSAIYPYREVGTYVCGEETALIESLKGKQSKSFRCRCWSYWFADNLSQKRELVPFVWSGLGPDSEALLFQ